MGAAFALFEARSGRFARGSRLSTTASVVLSSTGVLLIVAAAVLFGAQTAFPGVAALLPVLGTLLVIAAVSLSGGHCAESAYARAVAMVGTNVLWLVPVALAVAGIG